MPRYRNNAPQRLAEAAVAIYQCFTWADEEARKPDRGIKWGLVRARLAEMAAEARAEAEAREEVSPVAPVTVPAPGTASLGEGEYSSLDDIAARLESLSTQEE